MLIQQFKEMVEELYCQPKEAIIMGCVIEKKTAVDINVCVPQPKTKKKDKSFLVVKPKGCQDICKFFLKH